MSREVIPNQLGNAIDDNLYRLCNRDFTYLCVAFLILFGIKPLGFGLTLALK
jgi:hypothetical protein